MSSFFFLLDLKHTLRRIVLRIVSYFDNCVYYTKENWGEYIIDATSKKKKVFYGWIIVAASIIVLAAGIGIFSSTSSVFIKPICDSLGLSRGEYTLHRTILTLVGALFVPFYGRIARKVGVKKILLISAVALGAITYSYSFATKLWHFYAIAFFNGVFTTGISFMIIGSLINVWFDDKKGFATGLAYCGSGLGAAIATPIVGALIEQVGWRLTYRFMGIAGIIILIPTILFLIKETPQGMGLSPYKERRKPQEGATPTIVHSNGGYTFQDARKTPTFWLMIIGFLSIAMVIGGPSNHTAAFFSDAGYSTAFVSTIISLNQIVLTVGKIVLGVIFDKFGNFVGSIFVGICCIGCPLFALMPSFAASPFLYAIFLGLAGSGFSVPVNILVTNYFGNKDFSTIFSLCSMTTTFGSALSVPFMGLVYDMSGNYSIAFAVLLVISVLATVCLIGMNLCSRKLTKKDISL